MLFSLPEIRWVGWITQIWSTAVLEVCKKSRSLRCVLDHQIENRRHTSWIFIANKEEDVVQGTSRRDSTDKSFTRSMVTRPSTSAPKEALKRFGTLKSYVSSWLPWMTKIWTTKSKKCLMHHMKFSVTTPMFIETWRSRWRENALLARFDREWQRTICKCFETQVCSVPSHRVLKHVKIFLRIMPMYSDLYGRRFLKQWWKHAVLCVLKRKLEKPDVDHNHVAYEHFGNLTIFFVEWET